MTVIARLERKKLLVEDSSDEVTVPLTGGKVSVTVECKDLLHARHLVSVDLTTDPAVEVSLPQNVAYDGNKVTFDLVFAAGTTMRANAKVIGY